MIAQAFFRQWGAPLLAGGLAVGLGLGFWLYVNALVDAKVDAEKTRDMALGRISVMEVEAAEDAKDLEFLALRISLEQALSQERLDNESSRRVAAERRSADVAGVLNGLRNELEGRRCGIGPDLTNRLRDARRDREPGSQPGAGSTPSLTDGSLPTGAGSSAPNGTGTARADRARP